MEGAYPISIDEESFALALHVVGWAISEPERAQRMLALTGLDPDGLRESLTQPAALRALLDVVLAHEPDLLACARALGVDPAAIVAARGSLGR